MLITKLASSLVAITQLRSTVLNLVCSIFNQTLNQSEVHLIKSHLTNCFPNLKSLDSLLKSDKRTSVNSRLDHRIVARILFFLIYYSH